VVVLDERRCSCLLLVSVCSARTDHSVTFVSFDQSLLFILLLFFFFFFFFLFYFIFLPLPKNVVDGSVCLYGS
jgi:hypothetical protein